MGRRSGLLVCGVVAWLLGAGGADAHARGRRAGPTFVPMSVYRVGQIKNQYFVLLEDAKRTKVLPIVIGLREAQAIQLGLSRITPPRPLTHNLLENTIKALGTLQRVEIISLRNGTFIGRLKVKDARGRVHHLDARPSDLIALAVAARKTIWVARKVLDKAGIAHPSPGRRPAGGAGTPNA